MKKVGWGILFVLMMLLIWTTRVAVPSSAEALGFNLWALFLIFLTFLVGRKLWFTLFPKTSVITVTEKAGEQGTEEVGEQETEEVGEQETEEVDEPCVTFDLADERMNKNSGWDRIHVYANRYERSSCEGGPPSYGDVFEYAVQEKKVYQRAVEKKTQRNRTVLPIALLDCANLIRIVLCSSVIHSAEAKSTVQKTPDHGPPFSLGFRANRMPS
jgi:hypothetical protein